MNLFLLPTEYIIISFKYIHSCSHPTLKTPISQTTLALCLKKKVDDPDTYKIYSNWKFWEIELITLKCSFKNARLNKVDEINQTTNCYKIHKVRQYDFFLLNIRKWKKNVEKLYRLGLISKWMNSWQNDRLVVFL